jgi:hypothetical protein
LLWEKSSKVSNNEEIALLVLMLFKVVCRKIALTLAIVNEAVLLLLMLMLFVD